jgi:alanyl-tRNA synthetase
MCFRTLPANGVCPESDTRRRAFFLKTLDSGIKRFEQIIGETSGVIPGERIFELMDTFGFPVDLSILMAQKRSIDQEGFEAALAEQKARSRASSQVENEDWVVVDDIQDVNFVGYDYLNIETSVVKYRSYKAKDKQGYQMVLKSTPFYAESGGQVGDSGILISGSEKIKVLDTRKENDPILHILDSLLMQRMQSLHRLMSHAEQRLQPTIRQRT